MRTAYVFCVLGLLLDWDTSAVWRTDEPPCAVAYSRDNRYFRGRPYAVLAFGQGETAMAERRRLCQRNRLDALLNVVFALGVLLSMENPGWVQVAGLWTFSSQSSSTVATPAAGQGTYGLDATAKAPYWKWPDGSVTSFRPTMVNVLDYGADSTGATDSTTAIQNAINAVIPGGIVWFPPGTYRVGTAGTGLTMTTYHIRLVGASRADCVLQVNHATANVVTMNSWYCSIENMLFTQNVTRTGGYAVAMVSGNSRHQMFNCEVDSYLNGVQMQSHLSYIDLCEFRTFVAGGSWIEFSCPASAAHDLSVLRIDTDNGTNGAATAGFLLQQVSSLRIENCNLTHGGANGALYFNPGAGPQVVPSVKSTNCFFDNSGYGAQFAGTSTGIMQRIQFTNCWFSSSTADGVRFNSANTSTPGIESVDFVNCDFYGNVNGVNALAGYKGWSLTGCRLSGNSTTAVLTTAVATGEFSIQGCFMGSEPSFGPNGLAFNIQAGTYAKYVVVDNWGLDSNTTKGYIDAGTATNGKIVSNNQGGDLPLGGNVTLTASAALAATPGTVPLRLSIPAGVLHVGTQIRFECWGQHTATATGSVQAIIRMGTAGTTGDSAILTGTATGSVAALTTFHVAGLLTVTAIGAAPTAICSLTTESGGTVTNITTTAAVAPTAWNTGTAASFLDVNLVIAGTTPTGTIYTGDIEVVRN